MGTLGKNIHVPKCYFHFVFFLVTIQVVFFITFLYSTAEKFTKSIIVICFMDKPLKMCPLIS